MRPGRGLRWYRAMIERNGIEESEESRELG